VSRTDRNDSTQFCTNIKRSYGVRRSVSRICGRSNYIDAGCRKPPSIQLRYRRQLPGACLVLLPEISITRPQIPVAAAVLASTGVVLRPFLDVTQRT